VLFSEDNKLVLYDLTTQSWKSMNLTAYSGTPQEWLDNNGHVLMTGQESITGYSLPTVVNIMSGKELSLLEYLKLSQ
jgi:hypothetical protein